MSEPASRVRLAVFAAIVAGLVLASPGPAAQELSTTPDFSFESNQANALLGNSVAPAGDVNNDGFGDILVSAPDFDNDQLDEGRIFLFLGGAAGLQSQPAWIFEGDQDDPFIKAASAGDVDGDGFDDVVVSARIFAASFPRQGRVFVYAGSAAGLDPAPYQTFDGIQPFEEFGVSASKAGDVNGDGFSDILVGAHAFDNPENNEGRAVVFHGGP